MMMEATALTRNETIFKSSSKYLVFTEALKLKAALDVKQVFLTISFKTALYYCFKNIG